MSIIKHSSRLGALLTVMGVAAAVFAGAASASTTMIPLHGGTDVVTSQEPVVRTVAAGGRPGGQIALTAILAALLASAAAVLADRIRSAHRRPLSRPA